MALVTETLMTLIRKQVETHGTVVWYDPERAYQEFAATLSPESLAGAHVFRYQADRGFVWLRHEIEFLWQDTQPPRMLVYVPLAREDSRGALIEFEVGGVVMRPGQQPAEQNTALAFVARRALQGVFPPAALEQIVTQTEAGQLSLSELDQIADKGVEAQTGAVAVIFGTGNSSEVALRFLSDPAIDEPITAKQALDSLATLLKGALGASFATDHGCGGLRAQLARQVLVTEFIEALGEDTPSSLRTFPVSPQPVARKAAAQLAGAWRNRRDLAQSYVEWAERIQTEIGAASLEISLPALARTETFAATETRFQTEVEKALVERASARLVELAEQRLAGFWPLHKPELKTRWDVIATAGRLLLEAARVEKALKGKKGSAAALVSDYAYGEQPWCNMDTVQRHMERDFRNFDVDAQRDDSLVRLVALARHRYSAASDRLAEAFANAYEADKFEISGALLQSDVYHQVVAEAAKDGPVAYILVDALRFEMARELLSVLETPWKHELVPALATPPTITETGMAALLPGAERGITLTADASGLLATAVDGVPLKTRQERIKHLEKTEKKMAVAKLEQLAPLSDPALSKSMRSASFVLVTATEEIDGLCESSPALARRMLDDVLNQLRRAIRALFNLGVQTVVITADHGYLFGEGLTTGQAMDPPGGKTVLLKRRVWVGKGGADVPGVLRASLSAFGIGGDLEIATPRNLSCFKVKGGGTEYFHGGLSLQELVIPVLTIRSGPTQAPEASAGIRWVVSLGSKTIATRFVSVTVEGRTEELLPMKPPLVRVEIRAGDQPISVPVSASYGFQETTKEVRLQLKDDDAQSIAKNTVALMIVDTPPLAEVTIHLLDATTGVSLSHLDRVPFSITL